MCNVNFKHHNCPSARCASAVNAIDSDTDIFNGHSQINHWLISDAFTT
jgi:hypothetical protein